MTKRKKKRGGRLPRKRRMTKAERIIAEATRLADLLAAAPATPGGPLAPPMFINDPRLAGAARVWNEYAPRLEKLGMLEGLDRHTFAVFCTYVAEFVQANEDVIVHGYSKRVKTISGDYMLRENPSVGRRAEAVKNILDLSRRFGFTPLDRFALFRVSQASSLTLFGGNEPKPNADHPPSAERPESDGWAALLYPDDPDIKRVN
jgi:P27 family predicted phage terminase small subunit